MTTVTYQQDDSSILEYAPVGAWFLHSGTLCLKLSNEVDGSNSLRVYDQQVLTFLPDEEIIIVDVAEVIVRGPKR